MQQYTLLNKWLNRKNVIIVEVRRLYKILFRQITSGYTQSNEKLSTPFDLRDVT